MRVLAAAMPVIKTSGHSCLHALLLSVPAGACCQLTSQAVFTVAVDDLGQKGHAGHQALCEALWNGPRMMRRGQCGWAAGKRQALPPPVPEPGGASAGLALGRLCDAI